MSDDDNNHDESQHPSGDSLGNTISKVPVGDNTFGEVVLPMDEEAENNANKSLHGHKILFPECLEFLCNHISHGDGSKDQCFFRTGAIGSSTVDYKAPPHTDRDFIPSEHELNDEES